MTHTNNELPPLNLQGVKSIPPRPNESHSYKPTPEMRYEPVKTTKTVQKLTSLGKWGIFLYLTAPFIGAFAYFNMVGPNADFAAFAVTIAVVACAIAPIMILIGRVFITTEIN